MIRKIPYILILIPFLQGCVADSQNGEMEAGWLFWVFLGLLLGGIFIGAIISLLRKKKPDGSPTKAEREIEAYEETLNKKLKEKSEDDD